MARGCVQEMLLGRLHRALGQRAGGNLGVRSLHKSHRCPGQVARMTEHSIVGARPESRALWGNREENMPGYSQTTMSAGKCSTGLSRGHQRAVTKLVVDRKMS